MIIVLAQFGLMGLSLYGAKIKQEDGENTGFSYFVAGICCMGGIVALVKLF
jgi:hypothetical protein